MDSGIHRPRHFNRRSGTGCEASRFVIDSRAFRGLLFHPLQGEVAA